MFLMAILLVMLILLTAFIIMAVGTGGAICIIVFGDVIVCIAGIIWFIKRQFDKNLIKELSPNKDSLLFTRKKQCVL